jgi:ribonucleoside-diphosphate reductase alpha chain
MLGGGVGIGLGIRSADDKSVGIMPHLRTYDASSLAYRQGRTRRGSYATYLDISHPDILLFLEMRKPTGDPNMRALNLHHGINITDDFMQIIEKCMIDSQADDTWELRDPHTKEVRDNVSARELWQRILEIRMMTGEPYLHFIDTSNRAMPEFQKKKGLSIRQSNLCSEIILPTNKDRTAVCCLSSVNLEYYDEWKNNELFLRDVAEMLDNVLQYFIDNAPDYISRARFSAQQERSIGVGALGFHAYLQRNNIAFESPMAVGKNRQIFSHIRKKLNEANIVLAKERGEAPDAVGTGKRFSHLMAVAPNASSSIIMGNTSPSVEPYRANAYRQDTLSGSSLNKNRYLDEIIKKEAESYKDGWYDETWSSIIANDGSVQHLDWMGDWEKDVFKTSMEIDQRWVIEHAADRQEYIDQAQSINLFFRPDANVKYLHAIHFMAWKKGLKTLYYCRSEKIGKADKVSKKIEREVIKELDMKAMIEGDTCLACEG